MVKWLILREKQMEYFTKNVNYFINFFYKRKYPKLTCGLAQICAYGPMDTSYDYPIDLAAKKGHLEVIKYLSENNETSHSTNAMDNAASNGHLEVLKWLHFDFEAHCSEWALFHSLSKGNSEVTRWLIKNIKYRSFERSIEWAVQKKTMGRC